VKSLVSVPKLGVLVGELVHALSDAPQAVVYEFKRNVTRNAGGRGLGVATQGVPSRLGRRSRLSSGT
jgi:hypothetical protein